MEFNKTFLKDLNKRLKKNKGQQLIRLVIFDGTNGHALPGGSNAQYKPLKVLDGWGLSDLGFWEKEVIKELERAREKAVLRRDQFVMRIPISNEFDTNAEPHKYPIEQLLNNPIENPLMSIKMMDIRITLEDGLVDLSPLRQYLMKFESKCLTLFDEATGDDEVYNDTPYFIALYEDLLRVISTPEELNRFRFELFQINPEFPEFFSIEEVMNFSQRPL